MMNGIAYQLLMLLKVVKVRRPVLMKLDDDLSHPEIEFDVKNNVYSEIFVVSSQSS